MSLPFYAEMKRDIKECRNEDHIIDLTQYWKNKLHLPCKKSRHHISRKTQAL